MNRLSALLVVVFLSSCTTGFRIPDSESNEVTILDDRFIKLEKLCDSWMFWYKQIVVNSYHVTKFNYTLGPINQYAIEPEIDFTEFFESTETGDRVNDLRDMYNDLVVGIFKNKYQTIPQLKNLKTLIEQFKNLQKAMKEQSSKVKENRKKEYDEILPIFDKGIDLIQKLLIFNNSPIHPTVMSKDKFQSFIQTLKIGPKQTFAFKDDQIFKILKRNLVKIETFHLKEFSDKFFDYRSIGTVEYAIYLPFYDAARSAGDPCFRGDELPQFFSDKVNA